MKIGVRRKDGNYFETTLERIHRYALERKSVHAGALISVSGSMKNFCMLLIGLNACGLSYPGVVLFQIQKQKTP